MAEIYRNLLVIVCFGLLGWGLIRMERIYQYPFFMGAIFISFLLPQAFALVNNPGLLDQTALERVLLVSSLCAAACWLGYQGKPNIRWLSQFQTNIDKNKLFQAANLLMFIGYLCYFLRQNTPDTTIDGSLTGAGTIYFFFGQTIYIAFSIFLLEVFKKPSIQNIIFTLLSGWIPLQRVLIGRRQTTMVLVIMIGFSFFLIRRYVPPRWLVILAIFLMTVLIPAIGAMRGNLWDAVFSGEWQTILSTSQKSLDTLNKGEILELRNAAFLIKATAHLNLYGLGAGWWDAIIQTLIPGQILGFGFKQSLQFNFLAGPNNLRTNNILYDLYGYSWQSGTTPTGIGESFVEFGYLGCLVFALIGYFFKHLWVSAYYHKSLFSSLLYMGLISSAMLSLTHGIGRFLQEALFQIGVISLVIFYSRSEQNKSRIFLDEKNFKNSFR
ncbi:MAG: hypothetical protein DCF12_02280 [Snowella sp.]|jgi:hypothetical protein|nr:MAG: hypothetical protein DCF12_02280 [Snowella sp.]